MNNAIAILDSATLDNEHHWTLSTRLVAEGYGVKPETIRGHKTTHSNEILENHHWVTGPHNHTYWTRAGVIRLGMFITSPEAIAFRDAAETYLAERFNPPVGISNAPTNATNAPTSPALSPALDLLAAAVADEVLAQQLQDRVAHHLAQKLQDRPNLEATLGKLQLPIPRDWPIAA